MIQLEERLYTSTEVAEILGVSLRSVYRYIEENKLDAEVKTATGRHRFTKKNILDFLYPNGEPKMEIEREERRPTAAKPARVVNTEINNETTVNSTNKEEIKAAPAIEEEPVDWLAKFREAAKKFREENELQNTVETTVEPIQQQSNDDDFVQESLTNLGPVAEPVTAVEEKVPAVSYRYYRSALGGLKDIAQNLDKGARASNLEYAFTLNAGLSLYKPIKPFSLLHAYVKPSDLHFFENTLVLSTADESSAQLCLITDPDESIYGNREELHGLFVVTKSRLKYDISTIGDRDLVEEAKGVVL